MEIKSVKHKGLRALIEENDDSGLPSDLVKRIRHRIAALISATNIRAVNSVPGFNIHPLSGDREGEYAGSVNGNVRLTFRVDDDELYDLDLVDYH